MTATSSSLKSDDLSSSMALNGIQDAASDFDDMFWSGKDNYPWLAIDLGFLYKVFFIYM